MTFHSHYAQMEENGIRRWRDQSMEPFPYMEIHGDNGETLCHVFMGKAAKAKLFP